MTNRQPNLVSINIESTNMKLLLSAVRRYTNLLRISKEIHFKYVTQLSHKNEKCCIFKFNPSVSKGTTIAVQLLHDVLENSCLFSVILKSDAVKKK